MVEARGPEVTPQPVRKADVVAEDHTLDDAAPLAGEARRGRPSEPRTEPVGETREASAPSDQAPPVAAQDDVDPLAPEPGGLVEAVRGPAGQDELSEYLEACALRRRAAERQLEEHRLVGQEAAEAGDAGRET